MAMTAADAGRSFQLSKASIATGRRGAHLHLDPFMTLTKARGIRMPLNGIFEQNVKMQFGDSAMEKNLYLSWKMLYD